MNRVREVSANQSLRRELAAGYRHMAKINLSMSVEDEETFRDWIDYENALAEDDKSGDS